MAKGLIIALGRLARKRTHKFIQQPLAARFRFTEIRIRDARSHDVEIAPPIPWTPRRVLASGPHGEGRKSQIDAAAMMQTGAADGASPQASRSKPHGSDLTARRATMRGVFGMAKKCADPWRCADGRIPKDQAEAAAERRGFWRG
jgi:hypothetical protein